MWSTITFNFRSELWPFDCIFILNLCNLHFLTTQNSLTVHDIFMQINLNVYEVKTMCRALKWLFPLSWPLSYAPLNILLPQKSCTLHKSVTIFDIFMHLYWGEY